MRQIQKQHTDMGKMENEAQLLRKKLSEKEEKLGEKLSKGPKIVEGKLTRVEVGQEVYIPRFSNHGVVLSQPNAKGELQVQVGIMKVKVNLNELQESKKKETEKPKGAVHIVTNKTAEIKSEIDLRGMLVDDALLAVDKYLDDAYLSSLGQVSIIHGKGTGALRSAITDMLKHNRYVQSYRMGGFSEGGSGVTIVELKK